MYFEFAKKTWLIIWNVLGPLSVRLENYGFEKIEQLRGNMFAQKIKSEITSDLWVLCVTLGELLTHVMVQAIP